MLVRALLPLLCLARTCVPSLGWADDAPPSMRTAIVIRGQDDDPFGMEPATEKPASYRQYEPQNVPLGEDLPQETQAYIPQLDEPALAPKMPPIIPTNTSAIYTWTSGSGDDLGIDSFDLRTTLIIPSLPGVMITPGFSAHALNGPVSTDLPGAVYDNWIEVRWLKKYNDRWATDLAITPALYTDYENLGSDAIRIMGRALAMYTASPALQIAFGFIYLDREDVSALPAVGAIWTPRDDIKVEVLFPRPRVLYRVAQQDQLSRWIYLGGEFGGGSWAIHRPAAGLLIPASDDVATYSALRLFVGYETKRQKGFSPRVEAGWSFDRSLEYKSGRGDTDLPSAAMLRFGGSF